MGSRVDWQPQLHLPLGCSHLDWAQPSCSFTPIPRRLMADFGSKPWNAGDGSAGSTLSQAQILPIQSSFLPLPLSQGHTVYSWSLPFVLHWVSPNKPLTPQIPSWFLLFGGPDLTYSWWQLGASQHRTNSSWTYTYPMTQQFPLYIYSTEMHNTVTKKYV